MCRTSYNDHMGKFLKRRKLNIWIACVAILFNMFAPSISHAISAVNGKGKLVEICSVNGSKFVSVDQGSPSKPPTDKALHHIEHCPFCATHAGSFVMPVASTTLFSIVGGHDLFPPLFYHSPSPLFSWSRANPRAPPSVS